MLKALLVALSIINNGMTITNDMGGSIREYKLQYAAIQAGRTVRIDGLCYSACTLALSTDNVFSVCATELAVVGFHKPLWLTADGHIAHDEDKLYRRLSVAYWQTDFLEKMPENLRAKLASSAIPGVYEGADSRAVFTISAPEIWRYVPRCKGE